MHKAKLAGRSSPAKKRPLVSPSREINHREATGGITAALRKAILKSGLTHYSICKKARVGGAKCSPSQLDRFMSQERSLSLECADLIVSALELEVILRVDG